MLNQPNESEKLKRLFEKNTIRKNESSDQTKPLALPDPMEGMPNTGFARQQPRRSERSVLIPFKSPETSSPPSEESRPSTSSHKIAQLKRLYALDTPNEETKTESQESPPPDFISKMRRAELRLNLAQQMLQLPQSPESRLKQVAGLLCEKFALWRVRILVSNYGHPLPQALRVQYLEGRRNLPDCEESLKTLLRSGKESHEQQRDYHRWSLPLKHRQKILGALEILHSPAVQISADEGVSLRCLAEDLAEYLACAQADLQAHSLSSSDPLTGFLTYSAFLSQAEAQIKRAQQKELSLLRLEPDFLEQINEVHGYEQGDRVLQHMAVLMAGLLPEKHLKARLKDTSFAFLLPCGQSEALVLAEKLRQAIACLKIAGKYEASLGVTASIGLTSVRGHDKLKLNDLLAAAESALEMAQERGRNQVMSYQKREKPAPEANASEPSQKAALMAARKAAQAATTQKATATKSDVTTARKWSEILLEKQEEVEREWQVQSRDYGVPEVEQAVKELGQRLPRLLESLCLLLDRKTRLDELEKMPLSYFMPSKVVAEIRRGHPGHQLISYEVAFMLLQESLLAVLGQEGKSLQAAIDVFFNCINDKLTQLKSETQKGT